MLLTELAPELRRVSCPQPPSCSLPVCALRSSDLARDRGMSDFGLHSSNPCLFQPSSPQWKRPIFQGAKGRFFQPNGQVQITAASTQKSPFWGCGTFPLGGVLTCGCRPSLSPAATSSPAELLTARTGFPERPLDRPAPCEVLPRWPRRSRRKLGAASRGARRPPSPPPPQGSTLGLFSG